MIVWQLHRDTFEPSGVWGQWNGPDGEGGVLVLNTIENPDTLFPPGEYVCERSWFYRGDYECFEILVPDRERILVHAANRASELEGCVAPGMERGYDGDSLAVWRSGPALSKYMEAMRGVDEHVLVVTEDPR